MNKSKMATDLLSQGIRSFEKDGNELKDIIRKKIEELHKPKEWFLLFHIIYTIRIRSDCEGQVVVLDARPQIDTSKDSAVGAMVTHIAWPQQWSDSHFRLGLISLHRPTILEGILAEGV